MDLNSLLSKIPFLNQNSSKGEYFFALNIQEGSVEGAVWGIEGRHLKIFSAVHKKYEGHTELIEAANIALDEALADFQPEPTKVLFGVPDHWLQDDNLKEEYLKLLRHLVKELDVHPMAYVSSTHAVAHFLQKQSGVPTTAILIGVEDPVNVAVVKAGKVLADKTVKRSGELADDVANILAGFEDIEVLPSKIILYGEDKLEHFKTKLTSFQWIPKLQFLHLPKIEILEEATSIKALCLAGGSELNPDIIFPFNKPVPEAPSHGHGFTKTMEEPEVHHRRGQKEEVGFVPGDIEKRDKELEEVPEDVAEQLTAVDHNEVMLVPRGNRQVQADDYYDDQERMPVPAEGVGGVLATIGSMIPSVGSMRSKLFLALPFLVVLLVVAGVLFVPKATVTVLIDPKLLEKDAQVIADPSISQIDEANKKIPGKEIEITENGSDKAPATGKKQIGDAAKGSVNVYNLTSSKITLSQGTVMTSDKGLKFTLDNSVQIASQSSTVNADFTTVTAPGKAQSGAAASAIGPDSNLPAGTQLSIANYTATQVVAKVDSALTGGTSKDVQVVTSDDQKKLLASLSSSLRSKAQNDLQGKLTGDQKILAEALVENITSQNYSKKVGDQASEFTLNLALHYIGTSYSDNDLKQIVSKLVVTDIPPGYDLNLQDSSTQADVGKINKDGSLVFNAKFEAKLIPQFDQNKIKEQIKGKSPVAVADILKGLDNVVGSDIQMKPNLPGPLQRLPMLIKNITIVVKAK